jgi:hypothetical protein
LLACGVFPLQALIKMGFSARKDKNMFKFLIDQIHFKALNGKSPKVVVIILYMIIIYKLMVNN